MKLVHLDVSTGCENKPRSEALDVAAKPVYFALKLLNCGNEFVVRQGFSDANQCGMCGIIGRVPLNRSALRPDLHLQPKPTPLWTMRRPGRRSILVYCGNDRCHHPAELDADRWPDDVTFGELQPRMVCTVCGHKGADVQTDVGDHGRPDASIARRPTLLGRYNQNNGITSQEETRTRRIEQIKHKCA